MANRFDLSNGLVRCTISTQTAIPASAYPILAELAAAVEKAANQLAIAISGEQVA